MEIIEAENNRIALLKWKLIIVAVLFAVGFGIKYNCPKPNKIDTSLALCLIPVVAIYVDLLCMHLERRILVISEFFQHYEVKTDDKGINCFKKYEEFCAANRHIFRLENWVQGVSTFFLSLLIVFHDGFSISLPNTFSNLSSDDIIRFSGLFGVIVSIFLLSFGKSIVTKIKIDDLKSSGTAP